MRWDAETERILSQEGWDPPEPRTCGFVGDTHIPCRSRRSASDFVAAFLVLLMFVCLGLGLYAAAELVFG